VTDLDDILSHSRYAPRHGWHDDHRAHDGTPAYLPAMQQVRAELVELLHICQAEGLVGPMLQLGLGNCAASHEVWRARFSQVVTIDWGRCLVGPDLSYPGADTRSAAAIRLASEHAPYDLLFIDAGHSFRDVEHDYLSYGAMVRPGGIVAFHDALSRATYPEVEVHRYVATLPGVRIIGDEVGIAWYQKS